MKTRYTFCDLARFSGLLFACAAGSVLGWIDDLRRADPSTK